MDLRDLELLEVLAEVGTLTAAADRLYVSQPALSQRLTKLESRLGAPLFDREGRRLLPTKAGTRMLLAAHQVLTEVRSAERDVAEIRDGRDNRVRFTAQCSTTYQWLPPVIQAFRKLHPDVEVRIETVSGDEPVPALIEDRVDVALISKPDRRIDAVAVAPLFMDEMVAIVAPDHPWSAGKRLVARDLDDVHLLVYDIYDQSKVPPLPLPIPHGSRPGRVTTVPLVTDLVVEMVASGEGVGVLPSWVVSPYLEAGRVSVVRFAKPETRLWQLATRLGDQPGHVADFAEVLGEHFRAALPDAAIA